MRALWAEDESGATFHGEFFELDNVYSYPKPLAAPSLPIHVGGSSQAAARRAGRRGDGWLPGGSLTHDDRKALWELVKTTAQETGRDPDAIDYIRTGSLEMSPEEAERLAKRRA